MVSTIITGILGSSIYEDVEPEWQQTVLACNAGVRWLTKGMAVRFLRTRSTMHS